MHPNATPAIVDIILNIVQKCLQKYTLRQNSIGLVV